MMASICLCMIVKDEAAVLERCLTSVRGLIDSWVVCDTGSRDGTPRMVERLLAGVPGQLHQREWRDFGHNRNELLALATGRADYLLALDADMTVTFVRDQLQRLSADVYLLQHAGPVVYWIPRLVKGDRAWRYAGRTHEHLVVAPTDRVEKLSAITIEHHFDSGTRREKYERDLRLLSEDLGVDPGDSRTVFYLAQTHRDLGNRDAAIELYDRRAAMGGWEEEVFLSMFHAAVLRAERGEWPRAMAELIAAWEYRPARMEPVYELASRLRVREQYQAAYLFASRGVDRPLPQDTLFVAAWVYRWGLLFEYSIAAYWVGEPQAALGACRRLLALPDLPDVYREQTVKNIDYCLQRVPLTVRRTPTAGRSRQTRRRSR